jgi:DNA segregation ATPase FtsK/SpoIIIE, S-DNA-T family
MRRISRGGRLGNGKLEFVWILGFGTSPRSAITFTFAPAIARRYSLFVPRKDSVRTERTEKTEHRGFNDIVGVVLLGIALLLFVAMSSFERNDISANTTHPNASAHNLIGPAGAWIAHYFFQAFGAAAFVVPILCALFGVGCFFNALHYLRRRWPWGLVLFLCCVGFLSLFTNEDIVSQLDKDPKLPNAGFLENASRNLGTASAGGIAGIWLKQLFGNFGRPGASIIYLTVYAVSLLYLTNFRLGDWVRATFRKKVAGEEEMTDEERVLERRAKDLEKQARKLQEQVERAKPKAEKAEKLPKADEKAEDRIPLGADLQPVPEPAVRDLSIPAPKQARGSRARPPAEPPKEIQPADEGEVISAKEIVAATTEEILGKKSAPQPGDAKDTKAEEPPIVPEPVVTVDGQPALAAASTPAQTETPPATSAPKPRVAPKKKPLAVASTPLIGNYQLPPLELLNLPEPNLVPSETKEQLMERARLMQQTLAQFDIEVQLGDITKGPTITRYELHPAPGVKLEKISALSNNIAAALKAERIHILAPVPGKSSVGIEVPNVVKTKVIMRDLLESEEWKATKARIPLALGKDVYGHPIIADLAEMPHMLIAGSTGSGKSVCINSIVCSLLYRFSPDQLRFVMIDPKVVELQQYNSLPHLVVPVVTDPKKVILALRWVVNEMEKRYQIFAKVGVRNVMSFNSRPKDKPLPKAEPELPLTAKKEKIEANSDGFAVELDEQIVVPRDEDIVIPERLSYIVVIIDELADLMLVAPADVEMAIARITQMARAAGIHCIVATQRPSVDVITGVIKANIPARIAFQVASRVDSRTILDAMGADKLLGKGDMLFLPPGSAKLNRAQGALITDKELQDIVDFIAKQGKPSYEMEIHNALQKMPNSTGTGFNPDESGCDEDEEIIQNCIEVIRSEQKASVSLLQRRLKLGYGRAARIMDELENRGIVGPSKGAEPRDILIDLDAGNADGAASGHAV